jgi:prepilin signal peptidase PulO-like enzyme (type II secretory pathway)
MRRPCRWRKRPKSCVFLTPCIAITLPCQSLSDSKNYFLFNLNYKRYRQLGIKSVLDRLMRRGEFLLAVRIGQSLHISVGSIVVQWACRLVQYYPLVFTLRSNIRRKAMMCFA